MTLLRRIPRESVFNGTSVLSRHYNGPRGCPPNTYLTVLYSSHHSPSTKYIATTFISDEGLSIRIVLSICIERYHSRGLKLYSKLETHGLSLSFAEVTI